MDCRYSNGSALRARSGPFEGPARIMPPALPGDTYFHSVFEVSQPGCLGIGQGTRTYPAVYVNDDA